MKSILSVLRNRLSFEDASRMIISNACMKNALYCPKDHTTGFSIPALPLEQL